MQRLARFEHQIRQAARAAAIEEAAKVAEQVGACANTSGRGLCCETLGEDIAEDIRALSDTSPQ